MSLASELEGILGTLGFQQNSSMQLHYIGKIKVPREIFHIFRKEL